MNESPPKPDPRQAEPSRRDVQRAVLGDLVTLATQCARREAELDQQYQSTLEQDAKRRKWDESDLARKVEQAKGEIQRRHDDRLEEIDNLFQRETLEISEIARGQKEQADQSYDVATAEVKEKMNKTVWLADSVLEGTQNQFKVEFKEARQKHAAQWEILQSKEKEMEGLLSLYGVSVPPAAADTKQPASSPSPQATETGDREIAAECEQLIARVDERLLAMKAITLPKLFVGIRPYLLLILLLIIAGIVAQVVADGVPANFGNIIPKWPQIGIAVGGTLIGVLLIGRLLSILGKKQIRRAYEPLRAAITEAGAGVDWQLQRFKKNQQVKVNGAQRKRELEVMAVRKRNAPIIERAQKNRDQVMSTAMSDYERRMKRADSKKIRAREELAQWRQQKLAELADRVEKETAALANRHDAAIAAAKMKFEDGRAELEGRWHDGLHTIQAPMGHDGANGRVIVDWSGADWSAWKPPGTFPRDVRLGELEVDLARFAESVPHERPLSLKVPEAFTVPTTLAFPRQASLIVHADREGRTEAIRTLQMVMARLLTSLPPGRARFNLIDPVGLGQSFAGFMHLADHDETLVGQRILTDAEQIDQRIRDLTEHMETVIQKYLRNEFATIDEYNAQAGELAEPYRFIVLADFPAGFNSDSFRRLSAIASTGSRCGVYVLIARDTTLPLPSGVRMDDLEANALNLARENGHFVWRDDVFQQFPLTLDAPPVENVLTQILHVVGKFAREAKRVEVSFESIAPPNEQIWSLSASDELRVPIGRMGATRLQEMKLGKGVAQHVLLAGKTGSGKSTLLHVIATNLALWHSPREVELYLVDFKKGVEFKTYATNDLPHARAIAVESDREFGLSVLQRLDAELTRRGELFRKLGVQDLPAYRRAIGSATTSPQSPYFPRTLLIIDEFQEFFSEDDKLAQDASVLIDRLVRQGRAFGIHVLLGSQTIGGAGLPRSTLGQMAVRIALQTSEADSQLILGDTNSAARLLTRPGEAIYNDQGGLVEGNSPFQVSWLPDEKRDRYLAKVREVNRDRRVARASQIIFEGNAPAPVTRNRMLAELLSRPAYPAATFAPVAWIGEPVAIKEPTSIPFRRQSGANALMIGQQDEAALAMMMTSMVSLAAQLAPPQGLFYVFDGTPADSPLVGLLEGLPQKLPHSTKVVEWRQTEDAINELVAEMERREGEPGSNSPSLFIFIYGLQRYRVLRRQEDSFSFGSSADEAKGPAPDKQFADLLREGPNVGMHVVAWADSPATVERTIDRSSMREFDHRILFQMSANDSSNLIDSPAANKLGMNRALAYSEEQGVMEKFRPYALPHPKWLDQVYEALAARAG